MTIIKRKTFIIKHFANLAKCLIINVLRLIIVILFFIAFLNITYVARHTWATLAFYMGIPVGIICQSLGHSSVRVTETYLKPFENERIDKANRKLISSVRKCKWENTQSYNKL